MSFTSEIIDNSPLSREEAEEAVRAFAAGNPRLAELFSSEEVREKAMRELMAGRSVPIWEWAAAAEQKKREREKKAAATSEQDKSSKEKDPSRCTQCSAVLTSHDIHDMCDACVKAWYDEPLEKCKGWQVEPSKRKK
jgi:hypothetical protein